MTFVVLRIFYFLFLSFQNGQPILPPKLFVVDLMHNPGDLFPKGSPEAVKYQRI